jgi:hypothetical protein
LLFVVELVRGIRESNNESNMCHVGQQAYDKTLGTYHSWLIRKGVHLALHMLPYRHQLIRKLAGVNDEQDHPTEEVRDKDLR